LLGQPTVLPHSRLPSMQNLWWSHTVLKFKSHAHNCAQETLVMIILNSAVTQRRVGIRPKSDIKTTKKRHV